MTFVTMALAVVGIAAPAVPADTCTGACKARVQKRMIREHKQHVVRPYRSWIRRLVWCESRGDYGIDTGNGFYGAAQWTLQTWHNAGGKGMPHRASRLQQDFLTVRWRQRIGNPRTTMGWPTCG